MINKLSVKQLLESVDNQQEGERIAVLLIIKMSNCKLGHNMEVILQKNIMEAK